MINTMPVMHVTLSLDNVRKSLDLVQNHILKLREDPPSAMLKDTLQLEVNHRACTQRRATLHENTLAGIPATEMI